MIYVNEPLICKKEISNVNDCLKSGWISSLGGYIDKFENRWSDYCSRKYGVAVSNGTTALQLATRCLELKEGSEVIIPAFTIISCALAVIYNNLKPVLVDCNKYNWTIDVSEIEGKISKNTKAIMPVHIYGHPCDMEPIVKIAKKYNLKIIEDAAESHGAEYKGKKCGSFGDLSCFSFYSNKIITTGEGGMILTNNEKYYKKLKSLRNLCFGKDYDRFIHNDFGFNYRLTNIQAAIGVAQIENINKNIEKKRWIAKMYNERLKNIKGITLPIEESWAKNVYWMYGIIIEENTGFAARRIAEKLKSNGIETRPFFYGMHKQPVFQKMRLFKNEHYKVTEKISRQGLYLPSGLMITETQINKIYDVLKKFIN